ITRTPGSPPTTTAISDADRRYATVGSAASARRGLTRRWLDRRVSCFAGDVRLRGRVGRPGHSCGICDRTPYRTQYDRGLALFAALARLFAPVQRSALHRFRFAAGRGHEAVLLHFLVEGDAADAERVGSTGPVVTVIHQSALDDAALQD